MNEEIKELLAKASWVGDLDSEKRYLIVFHPSMLSVAALHHLRDTLARIGINACVLRADTPKVFELEK